MMTASVDSSENPKEDHETVRRKILAMVDDSQALDIGTGSGVLAVAAVLFGIGRAVGIDIDPCARTEAEKNVKLNCLEHRITILDAAIEDIQEPYALITANLRYPSLKRLCSHIAGILQKKGAAVVSGIATHEVEDLLDAFNRNGCRCTWQADEKGWAALVLYKD
jgi:ribosomal protein L11 methyltransferase